MSVFARTSDPLPFESFRDEYIRRVLAGRADSLIYIVPNRVAKNQLDQLALLSAGNRAISGAQAYTFEDFASRLFAVGFPHTRQLNDAESAVFIEESIRDLLRRGELSYFERPRAISESEALAPFPLQRGTFELIVNTLHRLSKSGVTLAELEADISDLSRRSRASTELRRAKDIARVFEGYLLRLGEEFVDGPLQIVRLLKRYENLDLLERDFRLAFPGAEYVLVDGFDVIDAPVVSLIGSVSELGGVRTAVKTRSGWNDDLFGAVNRLEEQLLAAGFASVTSNAIALSEFSQHLETCLFRVEESERIPAANIEVSTCLDPSTEVQTIARRIKQLYREDTSIRADLSKIVVASPNPEEYTPLFREVFAQFGIPAFIADRHHLDRAPLMRGVFALLDLARFGPRRTTIDQVLSSSYFWFVRSDGSSLDAENLRIVLARHHLSGTFGEVRKRLQRTLHELETKQVASATLDRDRARDIEQCQEAAVDLGHLHSIVLPLSKAMRPAEFQTALIGVFNSLHLNDQLLIASDKTLPTGIMEVDVRACRALLTLIEDLVSLFGHLGLADRTLPIDFYQERLRAAAGWTRYNPKPIPRAIQVLSLEQSVDQPAEYLFLAGLQEENLPRPYQPQIFLSQSRQPGEQKQLAEERLAFFRAITNFSKSLYLSSCRRSNSGRPRLASPFLAELQRRIIPTNGEDAVSKRAVHSYADLYREYAARSASSNAIETLLAGAQKSSRRGFYRPVLESRVPHVRDMERRRISSERSIFSGYIDESALTINERETLEANASRVWSVSQLELYARCPFQYFVRNVLRLEPLEEEADGLEASARGILLHKVLQRFMTKRREDERPIRHYPDDEAEATASISELRSIAQACVEEFDSEHPFWKLDTETLIGRSVEGEDLLQRFLDKENQLIESELRPRFFEVSFGLPDLADSDSTLILREEITVDGLKLRGKIDRIDVSNRYLAIVDYKTGSSVNKLKDIKRGISLQLPLYLLVAEDVLRSHIPELANVASVAGIYHKLCDSNSRREVAVAVKEYAKEMYPDVAAQGMLKSEQELRKLITLVVERARAYVQGIAHGEFPLVEEDMVEKSCRHCDFRAVCRVSDAITHGTLRKPVPLEMESSNSEDVVNA